VLSVSKNNIWSYYDWVGVVVVRQETQDVVKAIKLGAVDFLKKPLHDILPLVRKLLSEKINKVSFIASAMMFSSSIIKILPIIIRSPFCIQIQ
jgi:DNA-binding response OmpR family regulator